jgi:hypothetical protein
VIAIKSIVGGSANLGKDSACDSLGQLVSVIQTLKLLDAIGQFCDSHPTLRTITTKSGFI